jgi:uncharacterized protein
MNRRAMIALALSGLFVLLLGAPPARAADDDKAALKKRFEERYPKLVELKKAGKIGETTQGVVEAVKKEYLDDSKVKNLLSDENADRQKLYKLIAKDTGATPDSVATRAAQRNFEKAKAGEYLKDKDGKWTQKK